ncbi:hypothetical protein BU16DRAFT_332405 [Lophium mytilinum]|uniref:Uncharacterized protein n=1 Tax=Lophium mytilinum TaxID=390894 RepID=A0A6A6R007_9PEZI|nr:hypothetical protein BU16DRAFT_332405 [Lophium mytilinum]
METSELRDSPFVSNASSVNSPMAQRICQTTGNDNMRTANEQTLETTSTEPPQSDSREANPANPLTPVEAPIWCFILDLEGKSIRRGGPHPVLQRTSSGHLVQEDRRDLTREWSPSLLDNLGPGVSFNYNIDDRVVRPPMSDEEFEALPEWDDRKCDKKAGKRGRAMPMDGVERAPTDGEQQHIRRLLLRAAEPNHDVIGLLATLRRSY